MIGMKCFNICYSYHVPTSEMGLFLEDIETGYMVEFYNPTVSHMDFIHDLKMMIGKHIEIDNVFPKSIFFFGEYDFSDDENLIYLYLNEYARIGLLDYKLYACCICVLEDNHSFTFLNRLDGHQVITNDVSQDFVDYVLQFANNVYKSDSDEFYPDGFDSIVIGGDVIDIGDNHVMLDFNDRYMFGTKDSVYSELYKTVIKR